MNIQKGIGTGVSDFYTRDEANGIGERFVAVEITVDDGRYSVT